MNFGGILFVCTNISVGMDSITFVNKYPLWSEKWLKENNIDPKPTYNLMHSGLSMLLSQNAPFPVENVSVSCPTMDDTTLFNRLDLEIDDYEYFVKVKPGSNAFATAIRTGVKIQSNIIPSITYGVRPVIKVKNYHKKEGDTITAFGYKWICFENTEEFSRYVCETIICDCYCKNSVNLDEHLVKWLTCNCKSDFEIEGFEADI